MKHELNSLKKVKSFLNGQKQVKKLKNPKSKC